MTRRDTKTDIVEAALRLFAERGFEGVGMRDIADDVGVKPASLYKHFAGKQAIFEAVVERMDASYLDQAQKLKMPQGGIEEMSEGYASLSTGMLENMSEALFRYWTEDEHAVLFRHVLATEQYRNPAIGRLFRSYFVEKPIEHMTQLFASMTDKGHFEKGDAHLMALEFFAPISLLMQEADGCETTRQRDALAALIRAHVDRFTRAHVKI